MSGGKVPAGGRDVRLHVHDRSDDYRSVPSHLQSHGNFPEAQGALERSGVRRLVRLRPLQPPAGLHLLSGRGRSRRVRLLGAVHRAVGTESLRNLDDFGDIRPANSHRDRVPGAHLSRSAAKLPHEDAPRRGSGQQASVIEGQQRGRSVQGQGEDGEDDRGHRARIHPLLDTFLHRAALGCLGRRGTHTE